MPATPLPVWSIRVAGCYSRLGVGQMAFPHSVREEDELLVAGGCSLELSAARVDSEKLAAGNRTRLQLRNECNRVKIRQRFRAALLARRSTSLKTRRFAVVM